jgi:hypothetical protein
MTDETATTPEDDAGGGIPHGLRWGIKSSFIDYVRRMPDGKGSVGDGAVPVGTGDLFYAYDAEASTQTDDARVIAFRGDVRFSGHMGMLFVRIAHPRLEIRGEDAVLTIEDPEARPDGPRVPLVRATMVRLDAPPGSGAEIWGAEKVVLTSEGVELFNEVYAEGEPFEPLVVQLPASPRS